MLLSSKADYVFSAARFSFPIQRALLQTAEGGVVPFDPASIMRRSQDLAETFHDAGQLYWASVDTWLDTAKAVFGSGSRMLRLPDHLVQDIDTAEDWRRAELLYQLLQAPAQ
jgi:N-acylneuraminate cytidylyltransferase